uniref:Uncharacterized protein n=1 Tax=viral metagenome TaxID=1070528 RepID=A0A6H2A2P4_9ZZZZ
MDLNLDVQLLASGLIALLIYAILSTINKRYHSNRVYYTKFADILERAQVALILCVFIIATILSLKVVCGFI